MIRREHPIPHPVPPKLAAPERNAHSISPEIVVGITKLIDFIIIPVAALAAFAIYIVGVLGNREHYDSYALASLIAAAAFVAGLNRIGAYDFNRLSLLRWQATRGFLVWGGTASLLLGVAFITKISSDYSRGWAVAWWVGAYGMYLIDRTIMWMIIRGWARNGYLVRNIVIVGAGEPAQRLIAKLKALPPSEVAILGIFCDRPHLHAARAQTVIEGVPMLGTVDDLLVFSRDVIIDEVIVALPLTAEQEIRQLFDRLGQMPTDLRLSLEPLANAFPIRGINFHGVTPVIEVIDRPLRHWNALTKWFEDKLLGILLLVLAAPFMAIIAAAVKLDSRGPVFFIQDRFGFNNQVIRVVKFRTMDTAKGDSTGETRTIRNDPRLTRVGRILRMFSLDELPQLINVVAGQMSLVGPRPHAITMRAGTQLYHEAVHEYLHRHRVKPGITGWSQVNGLRGEIDTIEKARARVRFDLQYIEDWSIWMDLKILLMSFRVIVSRENAY